MCSRIVRNLEKIRLQGFGHLVQCQREFIAFTAGKARTFDRMASSTGVFDWLAMLANCRRRTLPIGARSMDPERCTANDFLIFAEA